MAARPKAQPKPRVTSLTSVAETGQTDNRGSINFSRPMSPTTSRPTSPIVEQRPMSPPSALRSGGRPLIDHRPVESQRSSEAENVQNLLPQPANSPVKKKKKKVVTKGVAEGESLANATAGAAPIALDVAPNWQPESFSPTSSPSNASSQPTAMSDPTTVAPKKMKKKKKEVVPDNTEETDQRVDSRLGYISDSDTGSELSYSSDRPRTFNTRPTGFLTKQPSMVREDREAEELEERGQSAVQSNGQLFSNGTLVSKPAAAPANTSKKFTDSRQHNRSVSQPSSALTPNDHNSPAMPSSGVSTGNGRGSTAARGARHQSLSPARAAHFSSQLQTSEGVKHNPLPRSVSPAKSALKHSPSRGTSPVGNMPGGLSRGYGGAPSEGSDTTSVVSEDGSRRANNRKKARVSFDNDTIIVGRGASPTTSLDSPLPLSPQNDDAAKKGWFRGRDKKSTIQDAITSQDGDDVIKPTPTLPSFGSVRGKNEKAESHGAPQTSWASDALARMNLSSDLAVGNIISQDFANKLTSPASNVKATSNEPLPPLVTSVEGTGDNSETESSADSDNIEEGNIARGDSVPLIAVQPATPGLEDTQRSGEWSTMPAGYHHSADSEHRDAPSGSPIVEHHPTDPTPASIGIAEPEPTAAIDAEHPPHPPIGELSETLRHQIEPKDEEDSDDTNGSIYSDAAEDLSDIEGDGFGSINAIVESPALPALSGTGLAISTPPDSPSVRLPAPSGVPKNASPRQEREFSEPGPDEGWDRAQAYWSGLSQSRKQQLEQASSSAAPRQNLEEPKPKPKKKKKAMPKDTTQASNATQAPLPPWPDRQYREEIARSSSPIAPAMKKSMRGSAQNSVDEPQMRTSMRDGQPLKSALRSGSTRNSVQLPSSTEPKGALQKKTRPVSAVAMVDYNKVQSKSTASPKQGTSSALTPIVPQSAKKSTAPGKIAAKAAAAPKPAAASKPMAPRSNLRRAASNGSDSSSSFKRARSVTSDAGRYSMKRTMRGSSVSERPSSPQQPGRSGAFSLRSLSPTGSTAGRRPFSSAGPSMRTSMRGSADLDSRAKSPTRSFGFAKSSKPAPSPAKNKKSRFSSKFGDSSDEEDGVAAYRSSRFDDSSDEDEPMPMPIKAPTNLTPVRGIPKRVDEGDSTDLEDSDIEKSPRLPKKTTPTAAVPNLEGAALATGSLRNPGSAIDTQTPEMGTGLQVKRATEKEKKKGSFFGLLGKKKDDPKPTMTDTNSPARLTTPSKADRTAPSASPSPASPAAAASPSAPQRPGGKLQRRNTPKRHASYTTGTQAWPLPAVPPIPAATLAARPTTSDGVPTNGMPNLGTRPLTTKTAGMDGLQNEAAVLAKAGKKKRFPMLRKAFGLHN